MDAFALTGAAADADVARDRDRDPRMDPHRGDILAVDHDVREVLDRVGDRIEYGFPGKTATRWLPLFRWQLWAQRAEVP